MNNKLAEICDEENLLVISILDPLSSKLPHSITANWSSVTGAYEVARRLCYKIHSKKTQSFKPNYFAMVHVTKVRTVVLKAYS